MKPADSMTDWAQARSFPAEQRFLKLRVIDCWNEVSLSQDLTEQQRAEVLTHYDQLMKEGLVLAQALLYYSTIFPFSTFKTNET